VGWKGRRGGGEERRTCKMSSLVMQRGAWSTTLRGEDCESLSPGRTPVSMALAEPTYDSMLARILRTEASASISIRPTTCWHQKRDEKGREEEEGGDRWSGGVGGPAV
jgi:hypothetical protein